MGCKRAHASRGRQRVRALSVHLRPNASAATSAAKPPVFMTSLTAQSPRSLTDETAGTVVPRALRLWLWCVATLVFAMVVVGGATRLTESGLSITEWKPITGALPPLNHQQWLDAFEKYKQIPQYRELFPTMDLARFQTIFLWEWAHRLLGRIIGLVFAVPLAIFWLRGQVPSALKLKLLALLGLGGLQGAVGWWMVASGLTARVEVAQERLAIHLLLASLTLAALIWFASSRPRAAERTSSWAIGLAVALVALVLVQIGFGALVAGLRAGLTYNTWPLMDGHFVPPLENLSRLAPWWSNLLDNPTTVQFAHRMSAYALLALALINVIGVWNVSSGARHCAIMIAAVVLMQACIGIITLLLAVPLWAGLLHQAIAMIVLGTATIHLRRVVSR